jgi:hypothetical protein
MTIANNTNRLLYISIGSNAGVGNPTIYNVSWSVAGLIQSCSMSIRINENDANVGIIRSEVWYVKNPTVGAGKLQYSTQDNGGRGAVAISYYNVDQDVPFRSSQSQFVAIGQPRSSSINYSSSAVGDMLVDSMATYFYTSDDETATGSNHVLVQRTGSLGGTATTFNITGEMPGTDGTFTIGWTRVASGGDHTSHIVHSIRASADLPTPSVTASATGQMPNQPGLPYFTLNFPSTVAASATYIVSGNNMQTGSAVVITPPYGFEVSLNNSVFSSSQILVAAPISSSASGSIYARLFATSSGRFFGGNIVNALTGGLSLNVAVSGTYISPTQVVNLNNATISNARIGL